MVIFKKRGRYVFTNKQGKRKKFTNIEDAVAAGGILPDEEVQVSGVPYTVPAKDLNQALIAEDDKGED